MTKEEVEQEEEREEDREEEGAWVSFVQWKE